MDYTEFKMRPAEEQEFVKRFVGPFPSSGSLPDKYAWLRKSNDLLEMRKSRIRVDEETKGIWTKVTAVLTDFIRGSFKPAKSVQEILKTKRA